MDNKSVNTAVVPLEKARKGILVSLNGRQSRHKSILAFKIIPVTTLPNAVQYSVFKVSSVHFVCTTSNLVF